jgi:ribosome maturation factor RimP
MYDNIESTLFSVLSDAADHEGFELLSVSVKNEKDGKSVSILIDKKEGITGADDCRSMARYFGSIIDVKCNFSSPYYLEVSSAGVERPLLKLSDYQRFNGRHVKIRLREAVDDIKNIIGVIQNVDGENITINVKSDKNVPNNILNSLCVTFDNIRSARLVMTDEMFRQILKNSENK